MPVLDGAEATRQIREQHPDAQILVLTTYATDEFIFKARTTKVHAQNILGKLAASNRIEAVSIAVRQGLITL